MLGSPTREGGAEWRIDSFHRSSWTSRPGSTQEAGWNGSDVVLSPQMILLLHRLAQYSLLGALVLPSAVCKRTRDPQGQQNNWDGVWSNLSATSFRAETYTNSMLSLDLIFLTCSLAFQLWTSLTLPYKNYVFGHIWGFITSVNLHSTSCDTPWFVSQSGHKWVLFKAVLRKPYSREGLY